MKVKEKVFEVMPMEQYNDRNGDLRQNRDLILITDEQFPKKIAYTFKGANCKLLDVLKEGDIVEVTFDIRSFKSEKTGKYFTSLDAWKLDIVQSVIDTPAQTNAAPAAPAAPAAADSNVIYPQ